MRRIALVTSTLLLALSIAPFLPTSIQRSNASDFGALKRDPTHVAREAALCGKPTLLVVCHEEQLENLGPILLDERVQSLARTCTAAVMTPRELVSAEGFSVPEESLPLALLRDVSGRCLGVLRNDISAQGLEELFSAVSPRHFRPSPLYRSLRASVEPIRAMLRDGKRAEVEQVLRILEANEPNDSVVQSVRDLLSE